MTLLEYTEAFEKDPHAMAVEFFHCIKRGDFTAEEFNALQKTRAMAPLQLLVDDFYDGALFKAQYCDFIRWCDGVDIYHDKMAAERYIKLSRDAGQPVLEIQRYIDAMVTPRRMPTKVLDQNPTERAKILEGWNKKIDINGWRSWPKLRGN